MPNKILTPGQNVRLAGWNKMTFASFNTARNFFIGDETPASSFERAKRLGHETAWASYAGAMISSTPGYYDRQERAAALAVTLEDGDTVFVQGEPEIYVVKVVKGNEAGPRNSDPIHFIRMETPDELAGEFPIGNA